METFLQIVRLAATGLGFGIIFAVTGAALLGAVVLFIRWAMKGVTRELASCNSIKLVHKRINDEEEFSEAILDRVLKLELAAIPAVKKRNKK